MQRLIKVFMISIGLMLFTPLANADGMCAFSKAELRHWDGNIDLRPQMANSGHAYSTGVEVSATLFYATLDGVENYLASETRFDPDQRRLEVDINPSCRWSDGAPIIAEDFITGARIAFNQDRLYPNATGFHIPAPGLLTNGQDVFDGNMDFSTLGIEVVDDDTIAYEIQYPPEFAKAILSTLPYAPAPTHQHEVGDAYFETSLETKSFSGPYHVTGTSENKLTLVRNEFFCPDIPTIPDEIKITFGDIIATEGDKLLKQNVDVLGNLPSRIRVALFSGAEIVDDYYLQWSSYPSSLYLILNKDKPALQNTNVREAIRLAVDTALLNARRLGTVVQVKDTYSYRVDGYNPPIYPWSEPENYAQSIKTARTLMASAGYGPDNPLKVVFTGVPIYEYTSVAEAFRSMYSQIYIDVELIDEDFAKYLERFSAGNYDMALFGWYADYLDPLDFLDAIGIYMDHSIDDRDEFDRLMHLQRSAPTQAERYLALAEVEKLFIEENFILPIGRPARIWIASNQAKFLPTGRPSARDLIEFKCSD